MKRFKIVPLIIIGLMCSTTELSYGQKIFNAINKAKNVIRNAEKTQQERERTNEKINPSSVQKSEFHTRHIGKIMFAKGSPNKALNDESQFLNEINLTEPFFCNVYLEDPMYAIRARKMNLGPYDFLAPSFTTKYYINNELIAEYSETINDEVYKKEAIHSDILVPATQMEFEDNKFRVAVYTHVMSTLPAGKHKLKVEYIMHISKEKPNTDGSAAKEYDTHQIVAASGEVDVKIDAAALKNYCKKYGRPKFSKGVLQGQSQLEKQIAELIKSQNNHQPIYIYADDNWKLERGIYDRVKSRFCSVYYIYKNDKGRAEAVVMGLSQEFDGKSYLAPRIGKLVSEPLFKFVCLENYL